jgi:hypothetical protein
MRREAEMPMMGTLKPRDQIDQKQRGWRPGVKRPDEARVMNDDNVEPFPRQEEIEELPHIAVILDHDHPPRHSSPLAMIGYRTAISMPHRRAIPRATAQHPESAYWDSGAKRR